MTLPHHATDPAELGALEARRLIARRQLSAEDLASACIARVEAVDHAVNALVASDFDRLLEGARAADARQAKGEPLGPLHGLPIAVKDMNDVAGLPTTFGSEIFRDNVPTHDDALVAGLRDAGALPMGKTNNPEWSAGANTRNRVYGTTANPHDLTRNCGGSSGGSAVALACGYAPLTSGSDLGGSLRTPAAYCGVVGFRPSFGVVPGVTRATGLLPQPTSGPMARSVADCGLMLSVMARPDRRDPFTTVTDGRTPWNAADFARLPRQDLGALRIGITSDFGFAPTEAATRDLFHTALAALEPFLGRVEERAPDCTGADRIFAVLRATMFLASHARFVDETPELVGPNVTENVAEGRLHSAADVAQALEMQGAYHRRWQAFFETCDIVISPAVTVTPRDWHEMYPTEINGTPTQSYYHWLGLAYASTIAGHPSVTIPCGRDDAGLPFGLQIVGRRHDDLGVLAAAAELEAVIAGLSNLAPRGPDIAILRQASDLSGAEGFFSTQ
ncbi:MAG: amidase [Sediminimonas qiaohouensis]|uniref:Amidase n=1 Tax=Sediminimonas qiaohouensis TaxID=552061 RepID=A0A7C9HB64_9RHOB|nr:amidase [Sediminimonas qiaohouensis]